MHLWNRTEHMAYRAVVAVDDDRVTSFDAHPGAQPNITIDEYHEADVALRKDPRVIEVLASRGITDLDLVLIDTWAFGAHLLPEAQRSRRLGWADVWRRAEHGANPYANPITGLHLIVDMDTLELVEIEDDGAIDEPRPMGEYVPKLVPGQTVRSSLRTYEVSQPQGASFTLDGNLLEWERWSLRVGFNGREGLVLHTVGYEDGGRDPQRRAPAVVRRDGRPVPRPDHRPPAPHGVRRRRVGHGVHDHRRWSSAATASARSPTSTPCCTTRRGEPYEIPNAICIHEEDSGVLWKHVDEHAGTEVRRQRRLVVSFHATVANYEYLVYWRFYEDGAIECEVRATGIMVTTHFAGEMPPYGTLVDERTYAPMHQHFIVARLDLDADGEENTVVASASEVLPIGPTNEHGLAVVQRSEPLRTEREGRQDYDWATQRSWKVVNERSRNGLGTPGGLQARARRGDPAVARSLLAGAAARGRAGAHAVGHAVRARGALAVRRDGGAGDVGPRAAGVDGGGPPDPERRRRALVRLRHPPRDPPGGLAGDARRHRVVLAEAGGVLRPQPGVGRGAAARAPRALSGAPLRRRRRRGKRAPRCHFPTRAHQLPHIGSR